MADLFMADLWVEIWQKVYGVGLKVVSVGCCVLG